MSIKKDKNKGFTMIETLIYVALVGVVITGFVSFGNQMVNSRNKNYVITEVNNNVKTSIELISQKLKSAEGILSSEMESDSIELDMTDTNQNLTIYKNNGVIYFLEGATTTQITGAEIEITDFKFTNLTSNSNFGNVQVKITGKYRNSPSKDFEYISSMRTSVSLRNK